MRRIAAITYPSIDLSQREPKFGQEGLSTWGCTATSFEISTPQCSPQVTARLRVEFADGPIV